MRGEAHPPLQVHALEVHHGPRFHLGPVSFVVGAGERVALVGPSGGGKTTLLRQISGTAPRPHAGRVSLDGVDVRALPRRRRCAAVGMLHQSHDLVEPLMVRHNVQAGLLGRWSLATATLAMMGLVRAPEADAALARVGLEQRAADRTAQLSGGEKQRVALARLLVQRPRLWLADEPVASLDPVLAREVLELLTTLAGDGRGALVCSLHQPDLARDHFDRMIGIREGRVVFDAPPGDLAPGDLDALYGREPRAPGLGAR